MSLKYIVSGESGVMDDRENSRTYARLFNAVNDETRSINRKKL